MDYKFQFVNYDANVAIGNNTFVLPCTVENGSYMKEVAKTFGELAIKINDGEKTSADAIAYGIEVIDHLLGAGSAEKIFAGRKKSLDDVSDLCVYLTKVISEHRTEHKPRFVSQPPNRDERRKK